MMPKLEGEPVVRLHVLLYESDLETLRMRFSETVGVSLAIRTIIRQFLKRLEQTHPKTPAEEVAEANAQLESAP